MPEPSPPAPDPNGPNGPNDPNGPNGPNGSSGSSGARRRSHPRVKLEWPVTIALAEGYYQANLRDVSAAGVCFHLDRRVPEMSVLSLQLDLPLSGGARRIRGRGAVVRCIPISPAVDHYEVAVFFHELADADREALTRFVRERD